jgi:hypothetical protein
MSVENLDPEAAQAIAVSFSTRIALPSRWLIDEVVAREGISIRDVIEQALEARWGSGSTTAPSTPVKGVAA